MLSAVRHSASEILRQLKSPDPHRLPQHRFGNRRFIHPQKQLAEIMKAAGEPRVIGAKHLAFHCYVNDLDGIEYCFSPGVSTESGFEADLAQRGVKVFLADFSVDEPAESNPNFIFDKKFVGALSDATFMTLDEWKDAKIPGYEDDLILQMDVEGAEFETLLSASAGLLAQFRVMIIEFHYLQELFNKPFFVLASRVFEKLLQTHRVVHIHPNNCCGSVKSKGLEIPRVAEFTFYRRDRLRQEGYRRTFPHSLDRDNTRKRTLILPACWQG